MNTPEKNLKELTDSVERYERRSRKGVLLYSIIIPAILLISYSIAGVLLVKQLETQKNTLTSQIQEQKKEIKNKKIEIEKQGTEVKSLSMNKKLLEEEIGKIETEVKSLSPRSMTIYLAVKSQSQEKIAQRIRDKYLKIGGKETGVQTKNIDIESHRRGNPPYTTEVRYFNLPKDLKLAQSIVFTLQNEYKIIHSRISFVKDKRPLGTIEIHFNNSF